MELFRAILYAGHERGISLCPDCGAAMRKLHPEVPKDEAFMEVMLNMFPVGARGLLVAGMMITSDHRAHMSTRNTVSCMGQGQATGTAAAGPSCVRGWPI